MVERNHAVAGRSGTKLKIENTGAEPRFLSGPDFARKVHDEIAKYKVIGRRVGMWQ